MVRFRLPPRIRPTTELNELKGFVSLSTRTRYLLGSKGIDSAGELACPSSEYTWAMSLLRLEGCGRVTIVEIYDWLIANSFVPEIQE